MTQIIVDQALGAKLLGLTAAAELCDPSGQPLGRFLPQQEYVRLLCAVAERQCPYSKEELAQFRQPSAGKPLGEFWQQLGGRRTSGGKF